MRSIIIILFNLLLIQCNHPTEKYIPFVDVEKVPIIKATLNNKSCYLMVDTGASISILDITQSKSYNFKITSVSNEVLGLGGKTNYYDLDNANVEIDSLRFVNSFKGGDLNQLVRTIRVNSGYNIVGIVGSDIFKLHGFKIDYSTNSIKY